MGSDTPNFINCSIIFRKAAVLERIRRRGLAQSDEKYVKGVVGCSVRLGRRKLGATELFGSTAGFVRLGRPTIYHLPMRYGCSDRVAPSQLFLLRYRAPKRHLARKFNSIEASLLKHQLDLIFGKALFQRCAKAIIGVGPHRIEASILVGFERYR